MRLDHESLMVPCVCVCVFEGGVALCFGVTPVPVFEVAVLLSPCGWRSAAQVSCPSTCLPEPGAASLLPPLSALPLQTLSSCRTSVCATSLQDSPSHLSCAAPSASLPALQPVREERRRGGCELTTDCQLIDHSLGDYNSRSFYENNHLTCGY